MAHYSQTCGQAADLPGLEKLFAFTPDSRQVLASGVCECVCVSWWWVASDGHWPREERAAIARQEAGRGVCVCAVP